MSAVPRYRKMIWVSTAKVLHENFAAFKKSGKIDGSVVPENERPAAARAFEKILKTADRRANAAVRERKSKAKKAAPKKVPMKAKATTVTLSE